MIAQNVKQAVFEKLFQVVVLPKISVNAWLVTKT